MILTTAFGVLCLLIWAFLILGQGFFWLARERDDRDEPPSPAVWPSVCVVVPARDEVDVIARSIGSLLSQDYPGPYQVMLVDDASTDGTASAAMAEAAVLGAQARFQIVSGSALPKGWTGKLWALAQGVERADQASAPADYLLLTDADIAHAPDNVRSLVARAKAGDLVLTSLMAKLHCATPAERTLIPAFVFFFDMLYPFSRVNDPNSPMAAAAGGCMLVDRTALRHQGGVAAIRSAIIDDCALGALMKSAGPIWLGLTERAHSLRPYERFEDVARMVSRSAYAQLRYSPLLLAGTLIGLLITYLAPPALTLFSSGPGRYLAGAAWALMAMSFQPMLRFYRRSPLWGVALPAIAALYASFTLRSAIEVWRGRGGQWKGRSQALAARS